MPGPRPQPLLFDLACVRPIHDRVVDRRTGEVRYVFSSGICEKAAPRNPITREPRLTTPHGDPLCAACHQRYAADAALWETRERYRDESYAQLMRRSA